jgi:acyl dehydratase
MTPSIRYDEVACGYELPPHTFRIRRADLIAYAGASGDFNPIHWSDNAARSVALPSVIAHGMLTMARCAQVVTNWLVDATAIEEYRVRFVRPVPVADDDEGSVVVATGKVVEKLGNGRVRVQLEATHDGDKVLGRAEARVALA